MLILKKRGSTDPLFFYGGALVLALGTNILGNLLFWWGGCILLLIGYVFTSRQQQSGLYSAISIVFFLYIGLLLVHLWLDPAVVSEEIFFVMYPLASFLLFSSLDRHSIVRAFQFTLGMFVLLSIWALIQYGTGYGYLVWMGDRANAVFYTSNTLAAALNLLLLPALVLYLNGKGSWREYTGILLLFAALLVSQSRGGYVAFLGALCVMGVLVFFISPILLDKKRIKKIAAGFILIFAVFTVIQTVGGTAQFIRKMETGEVLTGGQGIQELISQGAFSVTRAGSVASSWEHRTSLYSIAWQNFKMHPVIGNGFFNFQYFAQRDQREPFISRINYYVHNDYLQLLMETGVLGVIILLLLIVLLTRSVWICRNNPNRDYNLVAIALVTGMSVYFAQALVDFVLYPPVMGLLFGASLGIAHHLYIGNERKINTAKILEFLARFKIRLSTIRGITVFLLMYWITLPAVAQQFLFIGNSRLLAGDYGSAISWYERARKFAPYESDYYWIEAEVLNSIAENKNNAAVARQADAIFHMGAIANPYDRQNELSQSVLQRDHPEYFTDPLSLDSIKKIQENLLLWRPHDDRIQAEYVRTLYKLGNIDIARQLLGRFINNFPGSDILQITARELEFDYGSSKRNNVQ